MNNKKDLTVKEAFALAIQNHQNNNLQDAQNLYNKILEIDPNHSQTLNNLGVSFQDLRKNKKAKECFEKAIKINPNYADAHNNLGVIFQDLGENEKAKECIEKAIKINPNYPDAHNNLGTIFQDLGKNKKAKECFEKAIKIIPNYAEALNNLGIIFNNLGENQKAKDCFEKIFKINPNHVDAHYNLGTIFQNIGENEKAKECYEKAIKINPNYPDAHNNLGTIFQDLGENEKAKDCFEKVIKIDPNNINSINTLSSLLNLHIFDYKSKDAKSSFKELIILLLNKDIEPHFLFENAKSILFSDEVQNHLVEAINSDSLLSNKILQRLLVEELFHLLLQKSILTDFFLEKLLIQLRCEMLFNLENSDKDNLDEYFDFIISLAEQCWLNEYLYVQSAKEIDLVNKLKQKIENNEKINELQISILSCYIPLNSSKNIIDKLLNYKSSNLLFNDLISVQIIEPLKEKELERSIKSFDIIEDLVSKKVQEQYEEHPYPRWRHTNRILSNNFIYWLNKEIEPNKIEYNDKFNNPNVLIAGCGTGSQSVSAMRYKNANILAIDLSKSSLAYAKRKTEEFNIRNIEYMQADILQLKKLNKKFDIIESTGVLHHMKDPNEGLKVLVDILEPHGFLNLALYSKVARQHVVKAKELIKEKNYKNTTKDIKDFRKDILDKRVDPLIQKVTAYLDFYSTSMTRDLLFHVQEHRFTIPQISVILKDLNLEFLGFFFSDPLVKKKFSESFPEDKNNVSLDNWHQFEINNPDIFISMYQFWVKKN